MKLRSPGLWLSVTLLVLLIVFLLSLQEELS